MKTKLIRFLMLLVVSISMLAPLFSNAQGLELKDIVVEDASKFKFTFEQALQKPETAKAAVDKVIYDLENMENIVKDLDQQSAAASNGLTHEVVGEVSRRFRVAAALMTSIMIDTKMPLPKKKELLDELSSAVTQVFFRVIREEGEDENKKIEDMKVGLLATALRIPKEVFLDFTSGIRFRRSAKLKEVDANGKEINAGPGRLVPAIVERGRRDAMTLAMIQEMQEVINLTLNKLEDSDIVEKTYIPTYWGEKVLPRALRLRSLDLNAERAAAMSYAGFALWGFLMPFYDVVGMMDGGRSEFSLYDSSLIYGAVWTTMAIMKTSTISTSAVRELKKLIAMTKDQKIQPTKGKIGGFWNRFGSSIGVIRDGCEADLGPKAKVPVQWGRQAAAKAKSE